MYLRVKENEGSDELNAHDLENGQLYVDTDGDVNLVARNCDYHAQNRYVCFHEGEVIIMDEPPAIQRLITIYELGMNDE